MKKWLLVGSDKVYAIENFYVKYLREAGHEVELFSAQSIFYDYYYSSLLNKLLYKSGLSPIISKINDQFIRKVLLEKPDLVWVFKGMEIKPSSLQAVHELGIPLVIYNPDNPFIFTGKGSGNSNVTNSLSLYDLHFTYNLEIKKQLEKKLHTRTAFLPFGFDVSENLRSEVAGQQEIVKTCFLGNPDPQRAAFIVQLAEKGVLIDVYGNNWSKFLQHPGITCFDPVYGDELWKVLYRYRIQLNLMRIHNEQSHNMRSFETPGIGGIQLAPDTPEHRMFFEDGKEIFLYKDVDGCVNLINKLLEADEHTAMEYRRAAIQRSDNSGYDYRSRANFVADTVQQIFKTAG